MDSLELERETMSNLFELCVARVEIQDFFVEDAAMVSVRHDEITWEPLDPHKDRAGRFERHNTLMKALGVCKTVSKRGSLESDW